MGIKILNFQFLPWCFHFLGTHLRCLQLRPPDQSIRNIKLIKSDGFVKIYHRPINVSDLLVEFPKHLVCRSDSFYIGQKISPLPETDQLQLGNNYFLLPNHFFQSVLSFVTIASFASSKRELNSNSRNSFIKKAANCQPFDLQKTASGCLRIRVSDEFISQLIEDGKMDENENLKKQRVCNTAQLQKDYTQLVGLRNWKPTLETIKEKENRPISSFRMKTKKKSPFKGNHKSRL